jgi:hypothetical protein
MTAPSCPVSFGQQPYDRRLLHNGSQLPGVPARMPSIPTAHDLPTLIRTTNIMRDVLRSLTTSLTVNNVHAAKQPMFRAQGNTYYSQYPNWQQVNSDTAAGYVFNTRKDKTKDPDQRAHVLRTNGVEFQNQTQEDPDFFWRYYKALDG